MKVCVLGSGSDGNAIVLEAGDTRVLVDAGFSGVEIERRLSRIGVLPRSLAGIVLTHDHRDHSMGAGIFARRHGIPIYLTEITREACRSLLTGVESLVYYRAGRPFHIRRGGRRTGRSGRPIPGIHTGNGIGPADGEAVDGRARSRADMDGPDEPEDGIRIDPFVTVHDAADPVAIAAACARSGIRIGIATDLGRSTAGIRHALAGCDFLILEANHCRLMLGGSRYPAVVKQRIASSHGHLSNEAAARLAVELLHPRLAGILLAHLSRECNRPELARKVVGDALLTAGFGGYLDVASQDRPTDMIDIERLRLKSGPEQLTLL